MAACYPVRAIVCGVAPRAGSATDAARSRRSYTFRCARRACSVARAAHVARRYPYPRPAALSWQALAQAAAILEGGGNVAEREVGQSRGPPERRADHNGRPRSEARQRGFCPEAHRACHGRRRYRGRYTAWSYAADPRVRGWLARGAHRAKRRFDCEGAVCRTP